MKTATTILSQANDTYLRALNSDQFSIRYASVRSVDSKEHSQPGQDFLGFQLDDEVLAFALCDGVGQSFFGDFASSYLGERLLEWAEFEFTLDKTIEELGREFSQFLGNITEYASIAINEVSIPDNTPRLFREVLEEKRKLGSESMFICGRVSLPRKKLANGRLVVASMGDSRVRFGTHKQWSDIPKTDELDAGKRWSSRRGCVGGEPSLLVSDLTVDDSDRIRRGVFYSDGLAVLDTHLKRPGNRTLNKLVRQSVSSTNADDCSLFEFEIM